MVTPLKHDNASARYDNDAGIVYVTYSGYLTGEASTAVYDWLGDVIQTVGIDKMRGEVFDFREVTEFLPDNLMDARRNSRRYNFRNDVRKLPVAMIVKDFYQEEILRGPMQNVRENARKTIVRNMDEALTFINDWHTQQAESDEA
jgi:hypothetical protein